MGSDEFNSKAAKGGQPYLQNVPNQLKEVSHTSGDEMMEAKCLTTSLSPLASIHPPPLTTTLRRRRRRQLRRRHRPSPVNPNLTTCLYHTDVGLVALTWSRNFLGRSLHLHLHLDGGHFDTLSPPPPSLSTPSFHLHIKPFIFWRKQGSKKLNLNHHTTTTTTTTPTPTVQIFWDLTRAKFGSGSGPEPQSGFYIALVIDGDMTLLVGDSPKEAYTKTKAAKPKRTTQTLLLRREHVLGNKLYTTKATFGGKTREITIECNVNDDPRLCFSIDSKRVLQIKRLKWKFRGNERIEVDGVPIQEEDEEELVDDEELLVVIDVVGFVVGVQFFGDGVGEYGGEGVGGDYWVFSAGLCLEELKIG
ncbi:hypothetical protein L1049_013533 [Liquidambar formosana]|uniref:Uncharacterized protein n=1 Tax=Liquidambar formosana TaxID=63359 RepID=A0AAP0WWX9_LIQFO